MTSTIHRLPTPVDIARERSTNLPVFAAFALIPFSGVDVGGVRVADLAAILIAIGSAFVRPRTSLHTVSALVRGMTALVVWLGISSYLAEIDVDVRRLGHVAVWCLLAYVIASRRVHWPSAARGLIAGLVLGVVAFFYGVNSGYAGRLSGLLGDPNSAGMEAVVLGLTSLGVLQRSNAWIRVVTALIVIGVVLLTLSRTSMAALALALAWVIVGARWPLVVRAAATATLAWGISRIPDSVLQSGAFSDRFGSDALRERILAAEAVAVGQSPWTGNGAGTATIDVQGSTFYYHSSYLALRAEGGWVAIALMLLLVGVMIWRLATLTVERQNRWFEAALIGGLVCAVNLGEVFLALPTAVALGFAAGHAAAHAASLPGTDTSAHLAFDPLHAEPGYTASSSPDHANSDPGRTP